MTTVPWAGWSESEKGDGNLQRLAQRLRKEEMKDLSGKKVSVGEYYGKVTIINFWSTWCGPCRKEMKTLGVLHEKYKNEGLVVIGISLDWQGVSVVKPFVEKEKIPYPILVGSLDGFEKCCGVTIIPTTFFLDRDGNVVEKLIGNRGADVLEEIITPLLKDRPSTSKQ
jgi:thiol-disulfide isomerase/thioredoxin